MTRKNVLFLALLFYVTANAEVVQLSLPEIANRIGVIVPHAIRYPPTFSSTDERSSVEHDLRLLLVELDAAMAQYPDNPDILFYGAIANGMGHNMDFPGCDVRAIAAYEHLLQLEPESKRANLYFGGFLAGTAQFPKSVPYLKKAVELGVTEAHYMLGYVYVQEGNFGSALPEFAAYLETHPNDTAAKNMVANIQNGSLRVQKRIMSPDDPKPDPLSGKLRLQ